MGDILFKFIFPSIIVFIFFLPLIDYMIKKKKLQNISIGEILRKRNDNPFENEYIKIVDIKGKFYKYIYGYTIDSHKPIENIIWAKDIKYERSCHINFLIDEYERIK